MRDTKPSEHLAELATAEALLDKGILVAKPYFDRDGGDLLGFASIEKHVFCCRVQCKYRDCTATNNVILPARYVKEAFVLFLYLKDTEGKHLRCLLPDEVRQYFRQGKHKGKAVLRLSLVPKTVRALLVDNALTLTQHKVEVIHDLMRSSSSLAKMYRDFLKVDRIARRYFKVRDDRERLQDLIQQTTIADLELKLVSTKLRLAEERLNRAKERRKDTRRSPKK